MNCSAKNGKYRRQNGRNNAATGSPPFQTAAPLLPLKPEFHLPVVGGQQVAITAQRQQREEARIAMVLQVEPPREADCVIGLFRPAAALVLRRLQEGDTAP